MSDADLDALARLAAAAAEHLAALDHALREACETGCCGSCPKHARIYLARRAMERDGESAARHLVAAVDALRAERDRRDRMIASFGRLDMSAAELGNIVVAMRAKLDAAEAQRDALAAAVREERRLKALHRAALREEISAVVFDTDSDRENAAMAESRETAEAAEDATAHLDALLSGCAADVVRAGVVRDFLRAHDRVPWAVACDGPQLEREAEARTALDAALAAAEGR